MSRIPVVLPYSSNRIASGRNPNVDWSEEKSKHEKAVRKNNAKGWAFYLASMLTALSGGSLASSLGATGVPTLAKAGSGLSSVFKNIASGFAGLFKGKSKQTTDNDALLKSIYGDAYTSSSQSNQSSNWLNTLLKFLTGSGSSKPLSGSGGLLGSLLGIGSDYASSLLNMQNMQKLIDYQNEYNTPKNQMQRFADAGLNPNLIYGLGSNGNQPASGSIAPVDFATHQRENRIANMQLALQSKQVMADIAQKQSMTNLYMKQAQGVELENQFNAQTLNERVLQVSQTVSHMANELELQSKEINNWDDFRNVQLGLMEAQTYAAYLGSHSIYGKIVEEIKEHLNKISESLRHRFPQWADAFDFNDLPYDQRSNNPQYIPPGYNGR